MLRHVVVLVRDSLRTELEDEVGVGLAVDVHGVEVVGFDDVHANQDVQRIVGRKTLKLRWANSDMCKNSCPKYLEEAELRIESHDRVIIEVLGKRLFVDLDGTLQNIIIRQCTDSKRINRTLNFPTILPSSSNSSAPFFPR